MHLSYDRGGAQSAPPLFLFEKTIEKVIRLCTVLSFFSGSFEDKTIFHVIQEIDSIDKFVKNVHNICPYLHNYHSKKKINTVLNLITFSIVFTNKNRGGAL